MTSQIPESTPPSQTQPSSAAQTTPEKMNDITTQITNKAQIDNLNDIQTILQNQQKATQQAPTPQANVDSKQSVEQQNAKILDQIAQLEQQLGSTKDPKQMAKIQDQLAQLLGQIPTPQENVGNKPSVDQQIAPIQMQIEELEGEKSTLNPQTDKDEIAQINQVITVLQKQIVAIMQPIIQQSQQGLQQLEQEMQQLDQEEQNQ